MTETRDLVDNMSLQISYQSLGVNNSAAVEWYGLDDVEPLGGSSDEYHGSDLHFAANGMADFLANADYSDIRGQGQTVVVIDTGINSDHSFFGADVDGDGVADRIVYQWDFVDDDGIAETHGSHGSNVASIVGSSHGTYSGIAPDVDIIALNVFRETTNGLSASMTDIQEALDWVIAHADEYNIAAVNMSLGPNSQVSSYQDGTGYLSSRYSALEDLGVSTVVSSGNSFYSYGSSQGVNPLSAYSNVYSVGASYSTSYTTDTLGGGANSSDAQTITWFSQRHEDLTDIIATGSFWTGASDTDGYVIAMQGTSQAAPTMAGAIALMQQLAVQELGHRLDVATLMNLFSENSTTITDGDDEDDIVTNTGLEFPHLNLSAVAQAIVDMAAPPPPPEDRLELTTGTDIFDKSHAEISEDDDIIYATSADVFNAADSVDLGSGFSGWDQLVLEFDPGQVSQTLPIIQGNWHSLDEVRFEQVSGVTVDMTALVGDQQDYFNDNLSGNYGNYSPSNYDNAFIAITLTDGNDTFSDLDRDAGLHAGDVQGFLSIILNAGDGDDVISVSTSYRVAGGAGNDTINSVGVGPAVDYSLSPTGIVAERQSSNWSTILVQDGYGTVDTLNGVEHRIIGSQFDDTFIDIVDRRQRWEGQAGDDLFDNSASTELSLGLWAPKVVYWNDPSGINADFSSGIANVTVSDGFGDADTLKNIINVDGSSFDDVFILGAEAMRIDGGRGDDFFDLRANVDAETHVSGHQGRDEYWVSSTQTFNAIHTMGYGSHPSDIGPENTDTLRWFGTDDTLVSLEDANTDSMFNLESILDLKLDDSASTPTGILTARGQEDDNRIEGNSAANRLEGLAGNDLLIGGKGNDQLVGGAGDDRFDIAIGDGFDQIEDFNASEDKVILWDVGDFSNLDIAASANGVTVAFNTSAANPDGTAVETNALAVEFFGYTVDDVSEDWFEIKVSDAGSGAASLSLSGFESQNTLDRTGSEADDAEGHQFLHLGEASQTVTGSATEDHVRAGGGQDVIHAGAGADFIFGEAGNDKLFGEIGDDILLGGDGDDLLLGGSGNDDIDGGADDDLVHGNAGNDVIYGGTGVDRLYGDFNMDTLHGGTGDDVLNGGEGRDTIYGDEDDDTVFGGGDVDLIFGGAGDDVIYGNSGFDRIEGNDGDDTLNGDFNADYLYGGNDNDTLNGGSGGDRLFGESGNDTINGDDGNDGIFGGSGNDIINGGADNDIIHGNAGHDTLRGDAGNDRLYGDFNIDTLYGGTGDDILNGGASTDYLYGEDGGDTMQGGSGNDQLFGGADNDTLYGNSGFDTLNGGAGNDHLYGNFNADTFVFETGFGNDMIFDFDALSSAEKIDLSAVSGLTTTSYAAFSAAHLSQTGSDVLFDDGTGNTITMIGTTLGNLDAGDFIL